MKNKYKILTIIVSAIICLMVIYLHLLSHQKTQKIYLEQTEKSIVKLKKDFLKDTVNNTILEIDALRETKYINYKNNTEFRLKLFQDQEYLTENKFINVFIDRFNEDMNSKMWTAFLWNDKTGEVLYNSSELDVETIEDTKKALKSLLIHHVVIEKDDIKGIFGVSKLYIDDLVKKEIGEVIRSRKFSNGSYIWVNEVINYEGGKDYAIRRIHPNLIDTEGMYLSTDMEDIKGNLPYLEELNGIKENGETFLKYNFKKLNSSEISEKITYAKLYKDYDWIVAMGVHLDEIDIYTRNTNDEIRSLSSEAIIRLLGYIFTILLIGFIILYLIEINYLSNSTKVLEKEINIDVLTEASSRRYGEISLNGFFKEYKLTGRNPAIMMFDIDDFKGINDKYGHKVGDKVLREIIEVINLIIRSSDQLIRWGGDEFVGIFPGLREDHIIEFGEKILTGISALEIPVENKTINTTISIGFSYFKDTDSDYNNVLKRADDAMYKSKEQGKNRINILL